jgi:hypothetical protein
MFFHFEHRRQPLLARQEFFKRLASHALLGAAIIGGSLAIGILGYHFLGGLSWLDSLVNASMILGGMGPVNPIAAKAGKVFESIYALYAGIVFLLTAGIILAPMAHRILHRFHLETESDVEREDDKAVGKGKQG